MSKNVWGIGKDILNFPTDIVPVSNLMSDTQKNLINSGLLDQVDFTDPWGRKSKAYPGLQNPHNDTLTQIANGWNSRMSVMPDGWNDSNYANRAVVDGSALGNGMSSRKLTDTEIKDIGFAEGILKDFTHLTNRQSGMDVLEYSNPNSMWSALGNTDTYGAIVGLPTTASFPSGIVVPGVTNYLGVARTMNELGQILSNVPKGYSSGPCKFIEDIMNAIMKGGAILNDILAKILEVLGIIGLVNSILGMIRMLLDMILEDLRTLGSAIERMKQAALSGLLEALMKDPCMKYLITSGLAIAGTVAILKTTSL